MHTPKHGQSINFRRPKPRFYVAIALIFGIVFFVHHAIIAHQSDSKHPSAQPDNAQVIQTRQNKVQKELNAYLKKVTADGTATVSFYDLGAKSGSTAAKSKVLTQFYKRGEFAASSRGHTAEIAASTYKLYIAAYTFHMIHENAFTFNDTSKSSFEQMIVDSLNDFADDHLETWGMSNVDAYLKKQGWYSPVFLESRPAQTTALSLTSALKDLHDGSGPYQNKSERKWLLSLMGKQIYRKGIPTGAKEAKAGTTVTDKVGFYDDENNDAGIVTLPNGEQYILVVMTHGHEQTGLSGFPRIAKIAKHVQQIVYSDSLTKGLK